MSDLYYDPEKFGLTTLGEVEWYEPCYDFDTTAVWISADKTLYWASDSGCSCPSPFESFTSLSDATTGTFHDLAAELQKKSNDYAAPQIVDLLARVRQAVA